MTILVKDAFVYTGAGFDKFDILIKNSFIHTIGTSISSDGVDCVFNAQDKYLVPGFVDVHVHLREPGFFYKESILTGTKAAAAGGYTAVCAMPYIDPVPDCVENIKVEQDIIHRDAVVGVYPFASITKGRKGGGELVDFDSLKDLAVGFSDDGTGVQSEEDMLQAMERCAKINKVISAHCEVKQIARDCELAKKTGVHYHVCHISTKESVDIIRKAKADGVNVTCETGPHYLVLCDEDLQEDGRFKMNPPLRSREDRQALIEGLIDGTIDAIATDHAPHSAEEKSKGLAKSAMGVVGLETAFGVMYTYLVKTGVISLQKLIELMCLNPRKIFSLPGGKIKEGEVADLALLDLNKEWTVNPEEFLSKGRATPFEGMHLTGKNILTICKGEVAYEAL